MRHAAGQSRSSAPDLRLQLWIARALRGALVLVAVMLSVAFFDRVGSPSAAAPAPAASVVTPTAPSSGASSTTTTGVAAAVPAPPVEDPYLVPGSEIEPEVKQLAADIAYALTTYEASDDPIDRFYEIAGSAGAGPLAAAGEPFTHPGLWSRGEVVYPQLGGLTDEQASVMVVTRQTVGSDSGPEFSVVRTMDIRLVAGESGWGFDELASAGGTFDTVGGDLALAHDVASDARIEMSDSARLDILAGEISPVLLELMMDLADVTPYGVTVMATGHPYHVFGTDRVSHHTLGRAIDIYLVGGRLVVDDRGEESATRALVDWLYAHPDVVQIGSPWDVDGPGERRSFADVVHQDHIHVAVVGEDA